MKLDFKKYKWTKKTNLEGLFNMQWITPPKDLLKELGKTQKMVELEPKFKGRKLLSTKYLYMNNLVFLVKEL